MSRLKTKIFQIFYQKNQRANLDSSFVPYDNSSKVYPFNFEYAVFFDLYKNEDWKNVDLLGTVSWKFRQKTGLTGDFIHRFIAANSQFDVYFINPFPELCIYKNVWAQGNCVHPNLISIASQVFAECGYDSSLVFLETPPKLAAYCNYWIANKKFWDAYIKFLTPFWQYIQNSNETVLSKAIHQKADRFIDASYLPFIFERLFSTFLSCSEYKVVSIPINSEVTERHFFLALISKKISNMSKLTGHDYLPKLDRFLIKLIVVHLARIGRWRRILVRMIKNGKVDKPRVELQG